MGPPAKRGFDRQARGGIFRGRPPARGRGGWRGRGRGRGGSFDRRSRRSRTRSPSPRRSRERASRTHHSRSPSRRSSRGSSERSYDEKRSSSNRVRHDDDSSHGRRSKSRECSLPRPMAMPRSVSPPKASRHQVEQPLPTTDPYYGAPSGSLGPGFRPISEQLGPIPPAISDLPPGHKMQPQANSSGSVMNAAGGAMYSLPMVMSHEDPRLMQKPFQKEFKDTESLRITVDNDHYKNEKPSAMQRLGPPVETHQYQQKSYEFPSREESHLVSQMDKYDSRRGGNKYNGEKQNKKFDDYNRNRSQSISSRSSRSSSRSTSSSTSRSSSSSSSRSSSPVRGRSRAKKLTTKDGHLDNRQTMKNHEYLEHVEKRSHPEEMNDPRLRSSGLVEMPSHKELDSRDPRKELDSRDPRKSSNSSMLKIHKGSGSDESNNSVQKLLNDLTKMGYSTLNANQVSNVKEETKTLTETLKAAAGLAVPSAKPAKSILKRTTNPTPILSQQEPDKQIKSILKNKPTPTSQDPGSSAYSNIFSRNLEGSLPGLDLLDDNAEGKVKTNTGRFGFPSIDDEEEFLYGEDEPKNEEYKLENEQYKPEETYTTKELVTSSYQSVTKENDEKYVPQSTSSNVDLKRQESQVTNQPDFQNTQVQRILSAIGFDFDLAKKIQQQKGSEETSSTTKEETRGESGYLKADEVKPGNQPAESSKDVQLGMFDQSASFLSSGFEGDLDTLMKADVPDKMQKANDKQTFKAEDGNDESFSGVPTTAPNFNYSNYRHPTPVQYGNYPPFNPQNPPFDYRYPPVLGHGFPPGEVQHVAHGLPQPPPGHPPQFNANPWQQQFPYNHYPPNYGYQQQHTYGGGPPHLEGTGNTMDIFEQPEKSRSRPHDKSRKHKRKSKRQRASSDEDDRDHRKRQKYISDNSGSEEERKTMSKKPNERSFGDIEKETNRRLGLVTERPAVVSTEYLSSEDEQEPLNETRESADTDWSEKAKNIELNEDEERYAKKQAVMEVKEKFQEIAKHRQVTRKELEDEIDKKTQEILKRKKESNAKKEIMERKKRIQSEKEIYLRRMDMLEEELCRLRKQQSYLMRKRQHHKDNKDPVLMENTMLQDAIANQIHQLRRDYTEKKNKKKNDAKEFEKQDTKKSCERESRSFSESPDRESSSKWKRLPSTEQGDPDRKHAVRGRHERNSLSPQKQDIVAKGDRSRDTKDNRQSNRDSPQHVRQRFSPKRRDSREEWRRNKSVSSREKNLVEDKRYDSKRSKQSDEESSKRSKPKEKFQFEFSYFDPGFHFCKVCKMSLARLNEVFIHLHSKKHLQRCDPFDRPWLSDMTTNARPPPSSKTVAAPLKGVDFMMPVNGFYCKLCKQFFGDAACSAEHLKSVEHNKAYQKYIDENPSYEKELELMRAAALGKQDEKVDQASIKVTKKDGGFGKFAFKNEDNVKEVKQEHTNEECTTGSPIYEGPKLPPELELRKSVDIFQGDSKSQKPQIPYTAGKKPERYGERSKELYLPGEGDIAAAFSGKPVSQTEQSNKQEPATCESVPTKSSGEVDSAVTTTAPSASNIPKPAFIGRMPGRKSVSRGRVRAKAETKNLVEIPASANEKNKREAQQMAHIAKEMQAHMARAQLAAKQQLEKVQKEEALAKSLKVAKKKALLDATKFDSNQEEKNKPLAVEPPPQKSVVTTKASKPPSASGQSSQIESKPSEQAQGLAPPGMSPPISPAPNVPEEDLYSIDDMFMEDGTEIPGMDVSVSTSSLGIKVKPPPPVSKAVSQTSAGPKTTLTTSSKESIYGLFFSGK
ncbi:serine/arginine repetitive matrix protein 2-like [Anneissia japonica]|uniref:serine/arginine repetitive matrix protein 2-like n=1 Tax=Anneissia japonica TaxID=1529436 RepID=UPI0014258909|nr:serine/arginine repetitive matrix protein 2-like [Anneissia japonica]